MQNGVHGLFTRPGDSEELAAIIKKLVSDKEKLKQMSLNCIKRIKEAYNIDRLANQFLEIYQEIITN
jgi:glycosyltransferase involved in cell wall biosynthesis